MRTINEAMTMLAVAATRADRIRACSTLAAAAKDEIDRLRGGDAVKRRTIDAQLCAARYHHQLSVSPPEDVPDLRAWQTMVQGFAAQEYAYARGQMGMRE